MGMRDAELEAKGLNSLKGQREKRLMDIISHKKL